jgi:hypothetical protein
LESLGHDDGLWGGARLIRDVLAATASGQISPEESSSVAQVVEFARRSIETPAFVSFPITTVLSA